MNNNPSDHNKYKSKDIIAEESFSYEGYQVVRSEFLTHINEPAIIFNRYKIYANTACVNKLPHVQYVQFLVNAGERNLVIRPCEAEEKDAFCWSGINKKNGRKKPKQITGRVFLAKLADLTNWNLAFRYKISGRFVESNGEHLFVFNLDAAQQFSGINKDEEKFKTSGLPVFPAHWQNQFGLSVEEHKKSLQISRFSEYTVFGISDSAERGRPCR